MLSFMDLSSDFQCDAMFGSMGEKKRESGGQLAGILHMLNQVIILFRKEKKKENLSSGASAIKKQMRAIRFQSVGFIEGSIAMTVLKELFEFCNLLFWCVFNMASGAIAVAC